MKKLTNEEFIQRLKEIFKNKNYDYSKINYINSKTKVGIICHEKNILGNEHGIFYAKPNHLLDGHGCPHCAHRYLTTEEWIAMARKVHGNKYDYSKIEYHNRQSEKQPIICHVLDNNGKEHGEFVQALGSHLNGYGCPKCNGGVAHDKDEFIKRAVSVHGDKYDYSEFKYVNAHTVGTIICPVHGPFEQNAWLHTHGHGCTRCKHSKLEDRVARNLEAVGLYYQTQAKIELGKQTVDFYIPEKKTYIECQGMQHYVPVSFTASMTEDDVKNLFERRKELDAEKYDTVTSSGCTMMYYTEPCAFRGSEVDPHSGWYADKKVYTKVTEMIDDLTAMESFEYEKAEENPTEKYAWLKKQRRRWSYETCKEEAKKYSSKHEMKLGCQPAYACAVRNKWVDEFFENKKYPDGWWDVLEHCVEASKECRNSKELVKKFGGCYNSVRKHGWTDKMEYCKKESTIQKKDGEKCVCPYCGFEVTTGGVNIYRNHISMFHKISINNHLIMHPEDNGIMSVGEESVSADIRNYRKLVCQWLNEHGVVYTTNRHDIIDNGCIDIVSGNIGIDINDNNEQTVCEGGKDRQFHASKLLQAETKGLKLLQVFSDEIIEHEDIVKSKILRILKIDNGLQKVYGRKCEISEVTKKDALDFLNKNHVQGFVSSTVYLGAFCDGSLIGVMTFLEESDGMWNLTRFASDITKSCMGVGGKLFAYFVRKYNPTEVKSFADRRWTLDKDKNLYTNLGFKLDEILKPDYRYYNYKVDKVKRFHKFGFRKEILSKKYGFPMEMTESEMTKAIGFDKIWDCGLFRYVWKNGGH